MPSPGLCVGVQLAGGRFVSSAAAVLLMRFTESGKPQGSIEPATPRPSLSRRPHPGTRAWYEYNRDVQALWTKTTATDGAVHRCGGARGSGAGPVVAQAQSEPPTRTPPVRPNARANDCYSDNSGLASQD